MAAMMGLTRKWLERRVGCISDSEWFYVVRAAKQQAVATIQTNRQDLADRCAVDGHRDVDGHGCSCSQAPVPPRVHFVLDDVGDVPTKPVTFVGGPRDGKAGVVPCDTRVLVIGTNGHYRVDGDSAQFEED